MFGSIMQRWKWNYGYLLPWSRSDGARWSTDKCQVTIDKVKPTNRHYYLRADISQKKRRQDTERCSVSGTTWLEVQEGPSPSSVFIGIAQAARSSYLGQVLGGAYKGHHRPKIDWMDDKCHINSNLGWPLTGTQPLRFNTLDSCTLVPGPVYTPSFRSLQAQVIDRVIPWHHQEPFHPYPNTRTPCLSKRRMTPILTETAQCTIMETDLVLDKLHRGSRRDKGSPSWLSHAIASACETAGQLLSCRPSDASLDQSPSRCTTKRFKSEPLETMC